MALVDEGDGNGAQAPVPVSFWRVAVQQVHDEGGS
jgi:hypothetical protein